MAIKNITIKNFKSIANTTVNLSNINVILGPNGSGKTNFINVFKFLSFFFVSDNINYRLFEIGGNNNLINFNSLKEGKNICIDIEFANNNDDSWRNFYSCEIANNGNINNLEYFFVKEVNGYQDTKNYKEPYTINYLPTLVTKSWMNCSPSVEMEYRNKLHEGHKNTESYNYIKNHLYSICYYHFHDTGITSVIKQDQEIGINDQILLSNGQNIAHVLRRLKDHFPNSYKSLMDCLQSVAPYIQEITFNEYESTPTSKKLKLLWRNKFYDRWFTLNDLSDGTLRYLALLVCLFQEHSNLIIVLDEPELGLHPHAIRELASIIKEKSKKNQFILTTQNPLLVSQFSVEDIFVADYYNGETSIRKISEDELRLNIINDLLQGGEPLGDLWLRNVLGGEIKW